jgi:exonuclease SbcC
MRITRLYLRNYRVFEQPVELELPPGLVGIYGLNGAGKSTLVESIRFALYGRSRTANDEVRTSQVNAECVAEVEFEHEGHLYLVRRVISAGGSVRASAHADRAQVAEGPRDTTRYVHSILGMDDAAFRASVFAEQKQIAAFSQQTPHERRRLVLQLLGITPLDAARDRARKDAREALQQFEQLRAMLPDLDALRAQVQESEASAGALEKTSAMEEEAVAAARAQLEAATRDCDRLESLRQEHELLNSEARGVRGERDRTAASVAKLEAEVADLAEAAAKLACLEPDAAGWQEAEARLRLVEAVVGAAVALEAAVVPPAPPVVDEEGCEAARAEAEAARARLAETGGRLEGARAERERAAEACSRSAELTGEADCPLCGQALGAAFADVQAHRKAELAETQARVADLEATRARLAGEATAAAEEARLRTRGLKETRTAWELYQKMLDARDRAAASFAEAEAALGRRVTSDERTALAAEVERRRRAADECHRLRGRLERVETTSTELDVERAFLAEHEGRLANLAEKLVGLAFSADELEAARKERHRCRMASEEAATAVEAARMVAARARERANGDARRLSDAEEQHGRLDGLREEARHLGRMADLLNAFRNAQVATVGPRLSFQAADLFGELTDNEYDRLEVDPQTYEIKVRDRGLLYGMNRFSGSETDLANLALRVAISEHVRFQSGGAVGLLVLDEVFGPLDDDRKERMLLALERLRSRFRQVLVVTHDTGIKHQLPNAIEVVKLPGRRATARLAPAP